MVEACTMAMIAGLVALLVVVELRIRMVVRRRDAADSAFLELLEAQRTEREAFMAELTDRCEWLYLWTNEAKEVMAQYNAMPLKIVIKGYD